MFQSSGTIEKGINLKIMGGLTIVFQLSTGLEKLPLDPKIMKNEGCGLPW